MVRISKLRHALPPRAWPNAIRCTARRSDRAAPFFDAQSQGVTARHHLPDHQRTVARSVCLTAAISAVLAPAQQDAVADRAPANQTGPVAARPDKQDQQSDDDRDCRARQVFRADVLGPIDHAFVVQPVHYEPDVAQEENASHEAEYQDLADSER